MGLNLGLCDARARADLEEASLFNTTSVRPCNVQGRAGGARRPRLSAAPGRGGEIESEAYAAFGVFFWMKKQFIIEMAAAFCLLKHQ